MNTPRHVFVTYIRTTHDELWEGITSPARRSPTASPMDPLPLTARCSRRACAGCTHWAPTR